MAINVQKLVPSSFSSQQVSQEKLIEVKRSVIDVEKLMTGIIAFEKKQQDTQRQAREEKRYQRREDQLEKKQTKKEFKLDLPTLPRMGFFDWIKNFVTNTLLGFFAVRLLKYVPQLVGVAGVAMNAAEGILNFAGGLLNGVATFVEWGYKAYDATRGFLNQIGGDNVTKLFDKFLGGLDLFLTLSLGATVVNLVPKLLGKGTRGVGAGVAAGGSGRIITRGLAKEYLSRFGPKLATTQQRTAQKIPEKIIESTTGRVPVTRPKKVSKLNQTLRTTPLAAGDVFKDFAKQEAQLIERLKNATDPEQIKNIQSRLDEINVSRRTSATATGEGIILSRGIDPQKQTVEQFFEQQAAVKKVQAKSKVIPSPTKPSVPASSVAQSVGKKTLLRQVRGLFRAVRLPLIAGLIDFGISWALGEDPGRAAFRAIGATLLGGILGAVGSVVPIAGTFIGGLVGGTVGDVIGGVLYDMIFGNKKPQTPQQKTQGYASGGEVRRGPQKRIKKRREYLAEPTQDPVEPGKDVGKNKFEEMFPRGSGGFLGIGSKKDAYGYLESGYNLLSGAGFFGPLFGIAIKALTGDKPSSTDYRSASFALSNWMTSTFGNVAMQGYANGGLVGGNMFLDSRQIQRTIESSLEETVTSEVDDAINELRRRLGIEDKEGKEGKPGKGQGAGKTSDFTVPMSAKGAFGVTQYITGDRSYGGDGGQFYYDSSHGGGNYHEHLGFASKEARDRAIAHLENLGYYIGSMNDGRHAAKSLHYQDRAFDVPFYPNQSNLGYTDDREGEEKFSQDVRNALGLFPGGPTGKGGLFNLHENEWVVDFDSRKLYGDAFLHIMNATENESQRKQNSLRLMSILQSYAGYESGFEQTVTVPVPAPQMIPVPVPMQSNEPMMVPSGGGSSGRASDILESIG